MKQFYLIFFFISSTLLFSQEYKAIKTFDSTNQLLTDLVYAVSFDKDGYTWLATDNGIYKYNGTYFKRFSTKNGLPSNDVFYIKNDKKNRKWITGYYDGLYFIENDKITKVKGTSKKGLYYAFEKQDTIFFSTYDKYQIFFYTDKNKTVQKYPFKNTLSLIDYSSNLKLYIYKDTLSKQYHILNQHKKIVKTLDKDLRYYPSVSGKNINYIKIKNTNFDQFARTKTFPTSVFSFNGKSEKLLFKGIREFKPQKEIQLLSPRNDDTYKIFRGDDNNCIVFKYGIYDHNLSKKISNLPYNLSSIESLNIDSNESFWIIFKGNRLLFIPKEYNSITNYSNKQLFEDNNIIIKNGIVVANKIYLITNKNYLCELDTDSKSVKIIKKYDDLLYSPIKILKTDFGFIVSCGTGFDYFNLEGKNLKHLKFETKPNFGGGRDSYYFNDNVYTVLNLDITTNDQIIFKADADLRFNNIIVTAKNNAVISNESQILSYNIKTKKHTVTDSIKHTNTLSQINNNILVGTNSEGLYMLSQDLKILQKTLPNENIYKIHVDSDLVLIGTNTGLNIYKYKEGKLQFIKRITPSSGLVTGKITDILSDEKLIYLFSQNGFSIVKKSIVDYTNKAEIEIDYVKIGDSIYNNFDNRILSRKQNSLSIKTSIKTLSSEAESEKYYSLVEENEMPVWKKFTEAEINFKELLPGKYTFKAYTCSVGDNKIQNVKEFKFEIEPYFWETIWFKILVGLLIAALPVSIYYLARYNKTKKTKLRLNLINLEMKALKAQMNPHFIFNTLNNMQSTIILEDEIKVNDYFSKFAKLLRSTLDIVNSETIMLKDEIEYINSYVAIENLRMNPPIHLTYHIEKNLNLNKKLIPVMFLQPIVENAIVHGLSGIKTERNLKISIKKIADSLIIEIENNGLARKLNGDKTEKIKNHTSYATKIVANRIRLYKELTKKDYSFDIIDLIDENLKPLGTKVVLRIPIIKNHEIITL